MNNTKEIINNFIVEKELYELKNLKTARKLKGYSQEMVAEMLGIDRVTYSKYENGKRAIPSYVLIWLSKHLGVSVDYLLGLDTEYTNHKNELIANELGFTNETIENIKRNRKTWAVRDYNDKIVLDVFSGGYIKKQPRLLKDTLNLILSSKYLDTLITSINNFLNNQYCIPVHNQNGKITKTNTIKTGNKSYLSFACNEDNLTDTRELEINDTLLETIALEGIKKALYEIKKGK